MDSDKRKGVLQPFINQTYETYFQYLYRTEDTLYQLVYDRVHRPSDY